MTSVRLAHSRFHKNIPSDKKDSFDKVVTSVWSYDPGSSVLTYGATTYVKSGKSDFWNKKYHKETALKRFTENPIRVKLNPEDSKGNCELDSTAIDWFISSHMVYQYGTHNKIVPDVRRVHHERTIRSDFNEFYDPYFSQQEYVMGGPKKRLRKEACAFPYFTFTFAFTFCTVAATYCYLF
jgi:hypothetical protein